MVRATFSAMSGDAAKLLLITAAIFLVITMAVEIL
jgi:hypothetical protein